MLKASKKHLAITYTDYKIQLLSYIAKDLSKLYIVEEALPLNVVVEGIIVDEYIFLETLKKLIKKHSLKGQHLVFTIPENMITIRTIEHPKELRGAEIKEFIELELGANIHLPFDEPIIDIFDVDELDGQVTLYATDREEVSKLEQIFLDSGLKPYATDAKFLANLRLVEQLIPRMENQVIMVISIAINEFSLSIFADRKLVFIRYHSIDTELANWKINEEETSLTYSYDGDLEQYKIMLSESFSEIERIINFYQYSISKDDSTVNQLVLVGDNPQIPFVYSLLEDELNIPIITIDEQLISGKYPNVKPGQAELVGIALREELLTNIPSINLLPFHRVQKKRYFKIGLASAIIAVVIGIVALVNLSISNEVADLKKQQAMNKQSLDKIQQQLNANQQQGSSLQQSVDIVKQISYPATPIIEAVTRELKSYEYNTRLNFSATNTLIEVQYETFSDIANYIEKLQTNKLFKSVNVKTINNKIPSKKDYTEPVDEPINRHVAIIDLTLNQSLLQTEREKNE